MISCFFPGSICNNFPKLPIFLCGAVLALFAAQSMAQEQPGIDELKGIVANDIPAHWVVDELSVKGEEISEIDDGKRYIYQIDTELSPKEDLFVEVREVGPFILVSKTVSSDQKINLSGTIDVTGAPGNWKSGISLSHRTSDFGIPMSRFPKPALELGSADADEKIMQIEKAEIASKRVELEAAIASVLEGIKQRGLQQIEAEQKSISAELVKRRELAASELLKIVAEHATERGKLISQHNTEISELKNGLEAELGSLKRQVDSATEVVALQEKLKASLIQIARADSEAISRLNDIRKSRTAILSALPKQWRGTFTCDGNPAEKNNLSRRIEIEFLNVTANGFALHVWIDRVNNEAGSYRLDRQSFRGEAFVRDGIIALPLQLDIVAAPNNSREYIPRSFTLKLGADGTLAGDAAYQLERKKKIYQCKFNLSG